MGKKLLMHICCADCGLKIIDLVGDRQVSLYYYNPNIHPESEWKERKEAISQVFGDKSVRLIFTNWTPKDYFEVVKSPIDRCRHCWRLRLSKTFEYAKEHGYDEVSSTLFTSRYHDQTILQGIANELAKKYKIGVYLPKEVDHCRKTSGFYKQNYCGCIYSLMEKYRQKYGF